MTERNEEQQAQDQAKQDVVDRVASWQHGAPQETIREELDKGFAASEVDVPSEKTQDLAEEIHETKENPQL